jgi:predicted esterase
MVAIWGSLAVFGFLVLLKFCAIPRLPTVESQIRPGNRILVVLVHGLLGQRGFEPVIDLVRQTYPRADLLIPRFSAYPWSNSDPYRIANTIEEAIHETWERKEERYDSIVLLGYSLGAMVLRKSLVWAYGLEQDRDRFGAHGRRSWVDGVERFVSLAGINRGWSLDPRPEHMSRVKHVLALMAEKLAMLTATHGLMLALRRGAPFIADLRVQWIRLARDPMVNRGQPLPLTIHLLGDVDDVVSRNDSADLAASKDTLFITLKNTGHSDIAMALQNASQDNPDVQARIDAIRRALTAGKDQLGADRVEADHENPTAHTVVFLMHGIRDFGEWADKLESAIEKSALPGVVAVAAKYEYFPMGPFLLYWDRQKYVRSFMDEYTETLARFPRVSNVDYVGHSNGTYILASALQKYSTVRVRRVFFAGSVVPQRYAWRRLLDAGRVEQVVNVAANEDWVVAIFPRFFEFVAERLGQPATGLFDIGAAGFRGFHDSADPHNRVSNLKFVAGSHGAALSFESHPAKLDAVVRYVLDGDQTGFEIFRTAGRVVPWVDWSSRLCWLWWLSLAGLLIGAGILISLTPWPAAGLVIYVAAILLVLGSV